MLHSSWQAKRSVCHMTSRCSSREINHIPHIHNPDTLQKSFALLKTDKNCRYKKGLVVLIHKHLPFPLEHKMHCVQPKQRCIPDKTPFEAHVSWGSPSSVEESTLLCYLPDLVIAEGTHPLILSAAWISQLHWFPREGAGVCVWEGERVSLTQNWSPMS